jgi:hypothetical protein
MHFIPTYSSWLKQVECFFALLTGKAIRRGSFDSRARPPIGYNGLVKPSAFVPVVAIDEPTAVMPSAPASHRAFNNRLTSFYNSPESSALIALATPSP